jgi:dihydrofolate synthase / folylpolyglutamate synthase
MPTSNPNSSSSGANAKNSAEPVDDRELIEIVDRAGAEAFLDERIGHGVKPGLERITGLMAYMGDPQRSYPSIHIAGTNGKTTASRMVQQILGSHGLSTGGFTSPHLSTIEERFAIHGAAATSDEFTQAVSDIAWFVVGYERESGSSVTYFEVTAALAFAMFAEAAVDVAVVEVGLGGRLDATNVLEAAVSVVTGIDIDHVEFLGHEIAGIAREKVAILKEDGILVTGPLPDDAVDPVADRVEETGSAWIRTGRDFGVVDATVGVGGWQCTIDGVYREYGDLFLPIHGRHQVDHLATSIAATEMFLGRDLDDDSLAIALASITSPGRLEAVARRPLVILDGAHNRQGFEGLAATLDAEFPALEWQLVLGVRGERSVPELVAPLGGMVGHVFATAAADALSVDKTSVAIEASQTLGVDATPIDGVEAALVAARSAAGSEGGVVVTGSLYVVGEARALLVTDAADRASDAHLRFEAGRDFEEDDEDDIGGDGDDMRSWDEQDG